MNYINFFTTSCLLLTLLNSEILGQSFGANVPWETYEAESALTNGLIESGFSDRSMVTYEASGRSVVRLVSPSHFVAVKSKSDANRLTMRYSVPRGKEGAINVYINDVLVKAVALHSHHIWNEKSILPGGYFRFFDEVIVGVNVRKGDEVKLVNGGSTDVPVLVDFIDLESAPKAMSKTDEPWLDITDFGADGSDNADDTESIRNCLSAASEGSKKVWIPAGEFYINDQINVPEGVKISGAGMWHSVIKKNIPPASIKRALEMANDTEIANLKIEDIQGNVRINGHEGIRVRPLARVVIDNVWVANTFGAGILGFRAANVTIRNCRVFGTYADAIHLARDSYDCIAENNLVRNSGDDGLAIVTYNSTGGHNIVYRNNTVWFNYWGRGITMIGGDGNVLEGNLVVDGAKAGLLIAVEEYNQKITPYVTNFRVERNRVVRCGDITNQNLGGIWLWGNVETSPMSGIVAENEVLDPVRHGISVINWVPEAVRIERNAIGLPGTNGEPIYKRLKEGFAPVISGNTKVSE